MLNGTWSYNSFPPLILIGNDRKTNQVKNLGTDLSVENWAGIETSENDLAMKENPSQITQDYRYSWFH